MRYGRKLSATWLFIEIVDAVVEGVEVGVHGAASVIQVELGQFVTGGTRLLDYAPFSQAGSARLSRGTTL